MATVGYDVFFTEPGAVAARDCRVCGAACEVERAVFGPTSWAEAMARRGRPHDRFACPHADQAWHQQAERLVFELETAGPHCRAILAADLKVILDGAGVNWPSPWLADA